MLSNLIAISGKNTKKQFPFLARLAGVLHKLYGNYISSSEFEYNSSVSTGGIKLSTKLLSGNIVEEKLA